MTAFSTMTPEEIAEWERHVWAGTLWERPMPRHGTTARYQRGCFCSDCTDAHREYNRSWWAKRRWV